jgi:hypothetical protein
MIKIVGYIGIHVKHPLFLSVVNELEFSQHIFWKNTQTYNLMKIRQMVGVPCGQTDRRVEADSRSS